MNTRGLPAIKRYADGGRIIINPNGTASYQQPSGAIIQTVGGPNAAAALQAAYPTATVAESIPTENIRTYVDALVAAGGAAPDIKAAMDLYGVSPEQLAQAYDADPLEIRSIYNTTTASSPNTIADFERNYAANQAAAATVVPSGSLTGDAARQNMERYIDSLTVKPDVINLNLENQNIPSSGSSTVVDPRGATVVNQQPQPQPQSPSVTRDDILAAYSRWLNRVPSESEIQGWLEYSQTNNPTQTADAFIAEADKEARDILRSAYSSVLGRDPDESEIQGWIDRLGVVDAKTMATEWQNLAQEELTRRAEQAGGGAGTDTGGAKTDLEEAADAAITGGAALPGPGQYSGVPLFERQQPSALTFQPIQRGLAQLRGPAYMRGLTTDEELTPAFGGTGLPRETIVEGLLDYGGRFVPETAPDAEAINREIIGEYIRNEMVPLGLSPAEVAAANPNLSLGATQQFYNEFAPQGMFSTAGPQLAPQDPFVLQTGAYTPNVTAINPVTGLPYVAARENINAGMDVAERGTQPLIPATVVKREGGVINMAEGGKAMTKLTPAEAGSKFDISEFIDDQGRLISGYSRPVIDEYGVLVGYDYRPYERDVVFNPILARREEEERQGRLRMAKGGLADVAQDLASKGRFGDTMVAHISPQEAGLLKALGGAGTINPETGLPEFFKLFGIDLFPKKGIKLNLGPLGNIKVGAKSSNLLQAAAAIATGNYFDIPLATTAATYGGVRAAATGNLMEGIQAGLTAYGMGSAYQSLGGKLSTGVQAPAPVDTVPVGSGGVEVGVDPGMVTSQQASLTAPVATGADAGFNIANAPGAGFEFGPGIEFGPGGEQIITGTGGPLPGPQIVTPSPSGVTYGKMPLPAANVATQAGTEAAKQGFLRETLPASVQQYTPDFLLDASGTQLAVGSVLGGSLIAGQQERTAAAAQQAALNREREERKRRYDEVFRRTFGPLSAKEGGLMKLAKGGMTYMEAGGTTGVTGEPRDVTGTGDGMSDSVPASIEGVQEARLADGEFVIPADVVADIGNGSSDAGSKKLYDMMDRIRMARHGTTEQPPEIKAERLMPA